MMYKWLIQIKKKIYIYWLNVLSSTVFSIIMSQMCSTVFNPNFKKYFFPQNWGDIQ